MTTGKPSFHCPNCNALYQVVNVEAGPETAYRAINCRACGARFHLATAGSSSSILCFAQADAFRVGDDRICTADQSQLVVASVSKPDRRVYARRPAAFTDEARRFSSACRINRSSISV